MPISKTTTDPDGRLVIFVNGYKIFDSESQAEIDEEQSGTQTVYRQDESGYWGDMDLEFMKRMQDSKSVYFDGDNFRGSTAARRYYQGVLAGHALIEKIKSGEIVLDKGESIKIVAHSQGCAYAAGLASVFDPGMTNTVVGQLEEIPKIEVVYNLAPKQPKDFIFPSYVHRVVQYSSVDDFIAPQEKIKGKVEHVLFTSINTAFGGFFSGGGHTLKNYDFIFDIKKNNKGYVAPRSDKPKPSNPLNPDPEKIKPGQIPNPNK